MTIERLKEVVEEASQFMIVDHFDIVQKGGCENIVTSSDIAVQNFLQKKLAEECPESGFLCEEEDMHDLHHEIVWIIDPIDGTANYSRGINECAISVAMKEGDGIEMGVVYLPRLRQMFWAQRGKGAWLGNQRIHVSDRSFKNSIMSCALPVYHKEFTKETSAIICEVFQQANDIRRFGAAAPELCYLAMGRVELYFEYLLSPWDFAASSLILAEAGGVMCDLKGNEVDFLSPSGILAANNRENLSRLVEIVSSKLAK